MPRFGLGLGIDALPGKQDPDASSFISRAGITSPAQKVAVNNLATGLKAYGLWTLCTSIFPMVGGTAGAHSQDLKGTARSITWVNGPTHNAQGVKGNGTTQYGYVTNSIGSYTTNGHMAAYHTTAPTTAGDYRDSMGLGGHLGAAEYWILQPVNNDCEYFSGALASAVAGIGVNPTVGLFAFHRLSSTGLYAFKNTTNVAISVVADSAVYPPQLLGILCRNQDNVGGTPLEHSDATLGFVSYGLAMNPTQHTNFYNLIQAFQTALGRAV